MAQFDHINFVPPDGARSEAAKGLKWRSEYGRGGTEVGIARARDIKNGRKLSPSTVRRMKAFFDRHQSDKQGTGWKPGSEGFPSNGRIAHALWGGDAGYAWSRKVVQQMDAAKKKRKVSRRERRFVNSTAEPSLAIEYREVTGAEEKEAVITGTAIVFNSESKDLGGFKEIIAPEALDSFFSRNGEDADVAALWSHDTSQVLGRTPTTLKLKRDESGLHFELSPPKSRNDVLELVTRQDVRGASFAFTVAKGGETWEERADGPVRTITDIDQLYEISLVLQPAYEATQVGAAKRSLASYRRSKTMEEKRHNEKREYYRSKISAYAEYVLKRSG